MEGLLDPRAFWHSHQLFENRSIQLELHGSARDEQTGLTIPTLRRPVSSPRLIQRPQNRHPPSDSQLNSEMSSLDIQMPGILPT